MTTPRKPKAAPASDATSEALAAFARATVEAETHADRIEAARVLHETLTGDGLTGDEPAGDEPGEA